MAGALIAKAILGAIGGGFEGAAKPYTNGNSGVKGAEFKTDISKNKEKKDVAISSDSLNNDTLTDKAKSESINTMDFDKAKSAFNDKDSYKNAFGMKLNLGNNILSSDEELKKIYGDNLADSLVENFAKISAIDFSYTDEAKKEYNGENAVDDEEHIGIKAQELEENPATKGVVKTNENGNKEVDIRHLTAANTAVLSELARRVLELETVVRDLTAKLDAKGE